MNISLLITRSIAFTVIASALTIGERAIAGDTKCRRASMEIPSSESKKINITDSKFSFEIPEDFKVKTQDLGDGSNLAIMITSPRDLAYLDCANQNRMIGAGHQTEPIVIQVLPMDDMTLAPDRTGGEYERKTIKVAGGAGILARSRVPKGYSSPGDEVIKVVFANKQKYRVQIVMNTFDSKARKYNEAVFNQIISTFGFSNQPQTANTGAGQSSSDNRSPKIDGQVGAVNLGGSSYFSWGLLKSGSRDNDQPQIIMGYACQTQNQLQGISKRASVTRYVIKRGRGTDDWLLESLGGVVVKPTDIGYVPEKISGISGNKLKPYVTDASSGWLKRDMDVDGLGSACINGGVQGALSYIQRSVSGEPIATKTVEQLQPIAPGGSYAYPSPEEFAQFKKGLKSSPVTLSAADRKAREDFQAEWQKKNRAIAPYVGAWKTADNQDVYVFPSKVAGRVCVLRSKDGKLSPDLGVSMTTDMRYDGNNGLFKVDTPEVVAGRSGKTQPLSAFYGAIGSPDVSSIKGELEQAQCISELPKGGAIVAKKPVLKITEPKKASTNISTLSANVTPKSTESPNPVIVAKEDPVVKPIDQTSPPATNPRADVPSNKESLTLAANNDGGVKFTNPYNRKIQLNIRATGSWTYDPSKGMHGPDGIEPNLKEEAEVDRYYPLPGISKGSLLIRRTKLDGTDRCGDMNYSRYSYQNIGSSGKAILKPGETIFFIMNDTCVDDEKARTQTFNDNKGEITIAFDTSDPEVNPDIKIDLIFKENTVKFTDEEQKALKIAAENWEKLITRDKDASGVFKVVVTKDDRAPSGEKWGNEDNAAVAHIDGQAWRRTNFGMNVDVFGKEDFHNRIAWNSHLTERWWPSSLKPLHIPFIPGQSYRQRLILVMMHELGHGLGLRHPLARPSASLADFSLDKKIYSESSLMCSPGALSSNKISDMECFKGSVGGRDSINKRLVSDLQELGYEVNIEAKNKLIWNFND